MIAIMITEAADVSSDWGFFVVSLKKCVDDNLVLTLT